MKKPFKKTKVGKLLQSKAALAVKDIALGIFVPSLKVGTGVVGGIVAGVGAAIKDESETNLTSQNGGINKPNYYRILGYVIFIGLVALLLFGKIDQEAFEFLLDSFNDVKD